MKKTNFCILTIISALGSAAYGAATNDSIALNTNGVTIAALVNEALAKNPELNFYRAEISAAKANRKSAGLLQNPEVSGSVGHETSKDRASGLSAEGVAWSVSVAQPFEWPGRLALRKAIANRDIELAELGDERFKTALAGRVRALAYGLFAAQEKAVVAREVADRLKALREVLVQRDPAGLTPMLETRVIEATEVTMQHNAGDAELAARTALLELNQLRGASPDAPLNVSRPEFAFRPANSIDTLLTLARTNNFELRVRAVELAQQGFRVALARNERFPAISVGPQISENNGLERDRVIGVGVSFPLPLWNRNTANIQTAAARQIQAETSFTIAQREVELKVMEAALVYETKSREIKEWRPDSVEHFREAAELADRHYRLGAVEVSVYVELQKQYLEAVNSLLDTQKEILDAAQNLELLTGLSLPLVSTREEAP